MWVVFVVYWIHDKIYNCVYAKGNVGEDAELRGVVVEFEGQCNDS